MRAEVCEEHLRVRIHVLRLVSEIQGIWDKSRACRLQDLGCVMFGEDGGEQGLRMRRLGGNA